MTQFPAFAAVSRSFGYLRGMRIKDKMLHVPHPRARVSLDQSFFKSVFSGVQLYAYFVMVSFSRLFKSARPRQTIAFYPHSAPPWYNIWLVSQVSDLKITSDIEAADTIFVFEDETYTSSARRLTQDQRSRALNHRIEDISKTHVGAVFEKVFGYSLTVDPLTYEGQAVCKSDLNGTHDGKIVDCPIPALEIEDGAIYQRFIDSANDGIRSEDLRTAIVKGAIPAVFHKFKSLEARFGTSYLHTDVRTANEVFSSDEQKLIAEFCREIGLDFGCIDIMRDMKDNRIYIVDVNKTCMPVLSLSFNEQMRGLRLMGGSLRTAIGNA
ncbi:MAG: hypothetical protein AAFN91_16475 [Pseudomonadota bacterium]